MTSTTAFQIKTSITNAHTLVAAKGIIDIPAGTQNIEEHIHSLHRAHEVANPDCFVNYTWETETGTSFICGQPLSMRLDEQAMEEGTMSFEEYSAKWYPTAEPELEMAEPSAEEEWYNLVVR